MTDEEYVFHSTNKERKRNGYGDYHKKRQGGRYVKLPSDKITRKEWENMNGEIETYKLNKAMGWKEYKALPDDLKAEYLAFLTEEYHVGGSKIAQMFGVCDQTVNNEKKRFGIKNAPSSLTRTEKKRWRDFCGADREIERNDIEQVTQSLVGMLREYLGTGAKVTIELVL